MKTLCAVILLNGAVVSQVLGQQLLPSRENHDLVYDSLPHRVDNGLPLGNGLLGCTISGGEDIVLNLEHSRLWDHRPQPAFDSTTFRFNALREAWEGGRSEASVHVFEDPFQLTPAPTRLPAGRLRLRFAPGFLTGSCRLSLARAEVSIELSRQGRGKIEAFVDAETQVGRVRVTGLRPSEVFLDPPPFAVEDLDQDPRTSDRDLRRLGYPGTEEASPFRQRWYRQEGYGGARHAVMAEWRDLAGGAGWELLWTVVVSEREDPLQDAQDLLEMAKDTDFETQRRRHREWWRSYWNRSGLRLPERENTRSLEAQWYRTQYLHGCSVRSGAPAVSRRGTLSESEPNLLPTDKGATTMWILPAVYRHSLGANRPEGVLALFEEMSRLRATARDWTRRFYGHSGLNYPAVLSIDGRAMGGRAEHAFSSTASCQLALLFAEAAESFPENEPFGQEVYSFVEEVGEFLEQHLVAGSAGQMVLPLTSSPELGEASEGAWTECFSNYDLALVDATLRAAARLADKYRRGDTVRWRNLLESLPPWAISEYGGGLAVAPHVPLAQSHRHLSHLNAIAPIGLIDVSQGEDSRRLIDASLAELDAHGVESWIGSTFAWRAALAARARRGEEAAKMLGLFTESFCALNGVHLGGDQSERANSRFRGRVPSLDGNALFAAALQDMLLQSHNGEVEIFPATPRSWQDLEFVSLRVRGGFLVSARRSEGNLVEVSVQSEAGGRFRLKNPFESWPYMASADTSELREYRKLEDAQAIEFDTEPGDRFVLYPID